MILRASLLLLVTFYTFSCFSQSWVDSTYGIDCRNVPVDSFSKIKIDNEVYMYFQCDKSYYYTDSANKHHYTGEFIVPNLSHYKIELRRNIAEHLLKIYRIDRITLFETCQMRNMEKVAIKFPDSLYKKIEIHSFRFE